MAGLNYCIGPKLSVLVKWCGHASLFQKYQYYANPDIKDNIVLYLVPIIVYDMFLWCSIVGCPVSDYLFDIVIFYLYRHKNTLC